jgi:enoyl-CoA hydratase
MAMSVVVEERPAEHIALLRLNRPEVLNALSSELMEELSRLLHKLDQDDTVRVAVITGSARAFAAGADIQELSGSDAVGMLSSSQITRWEAVKRFSKPLIAAVSGWALGGGMELVMCCDMVVAGDNAQFGQPEIKIGVMPGAGGTQRLTKIVGKARAMEIVLTGRNIAADEALAMGIVNHVVAREQVVPRALELARAVASMPPVAVRLAKESVLTALDTPLDIGLTHERRLFSLLFSTEDQKEGMRAFLEKRPPQFEGR